MDLADGKLAYQQTKPFITTRGAKPLTPKGGFFGFCQPAPQTSFKPHLNPIQTIQTLSNLSHLHQLPFNLLYNLTNPLVPKVFTDR